VVHHNRVRPGVHTRQLEGVANDSRSAARGGARERHVQLCLAASQGGRGRRVGHGAIRRLVGARVGGGIRQASSRHGCHRGPIVACSAAGSGQQAALAGAPWPQRARAAGRARAGGAASS
jgi:hypothetical protein